MKRISIAVLCIMLIFTMVSTSVFASSNLEDITDEKKLELLTLSEIVYEIPSKTFWTVATNHEDGYNIMAGDSVRVIELDGENKKSKITICPQDVYTTADNPFPNRSLSYTISLYNMFGEKIAIGKNQKGAPQYKTTFTCQPIYKEIDPKTGSEPTINLPSHLNMNISYITYKPFSISLPDVKERTQIYLVVEPFDRSIVSEIKTIDANIIKPTDNNMGIIYGKIYYDYVDHIKNNVAVTSEDEFLNKIHPGKMYTYNKKPIYWKKLIRNILGDYTYAENSEDAKIEGWGFFAATFLNKKDKTAVIAYRGTEPSTLGDLADDVVFGFTSFKSAQMSLANKYYKYICDKYKDYEILLTGHSLGGALANSVTFEKMEEMLPSTPLGLSYNGPVSVAFNGATQHILDSYPKINIFSDSGNYMNIITDKFDILNSPIVGIMIPTDADLIVEMIDAGHISFRSYVPDISELSDPKADVHGLAGLVMYESGKFSLSPTSR